jgi:hypothetical protein
MKKQEDGEWVYLTRGLMAELFDITEAAIAKEIENYRSCNLTDKRTNDELRPFAINTIINKLKKY